MYRELFLISLLIFPDWPVVTTVGFFLEKKLGGKFEQTSCFLIAGHLCDSNSVT